MRNKIRQIISIVFVCLFIFGNLSACSNMKPFEPILNPNITNSTTAQQTTIPANQENQKNKLSATLLSLNTSTQKLNPNSKLTVHYIDVGQADSILVQSGSTSMLIDAGNNSDSQTIIEYLKKQKVKKLDCVIGTHPHEDHIGSLDSVINTFDVGKVYMPKVTTTTKTFEGVITAIKNKSLKITTPVPNS